MVTTKLLQREKLLVVSNISVMTITFLVLGMFITTVAFSQTAIRRLEKQALVTVFFKDEFPEDNILALQKSLLTDERVAGVNYVSKQEAFEIFTELNKDDPILLESISASILPASLEIQAKSVDELPVLADEVSKIDGVEEVKFFKDVIERFKHWSNVIYILGFIIVALLLVISFTIVTVTLRITISSKGKELEVLKLVGASDDYVKKPLIQQGMFFGIFSGFVASLVIILISLVLQLSGVFTGSVEFAFLPNVLLNLITFAVSLSLVLVLSGALLGYFGSLAAIKKYLRY